MRTSILKYSMIVLMTFFSGVNGFAQLTCLDGSVSFNSCADVPPSVGTYPSVEYGDVIVIWVDPDPFSGNGTGPNIHFQATDIEGGGEVVYGIGDCPGGTACYAVTTLPIGGGAIAFLIASMSYGSFVYARRRKKGAQAV